MRISVHRKVLKRMINQIYVERGKSIPFPREETKMKPGEMGEFYVHLYSLKEERERRLKMVKLCEKKQNGKS